MDTAIIADMRERAKAPGLNLSDAALMVRAVKLMEQLLADNTELAGMARKTDD